MIAVRKIAAATQLRDDHPDECVQMAGYAVEVQLKARIMEHTGMATWPEDRKEFRARNLKHLQTHDLNELLALSGFETKVKTTAMVPWSLCASWNPESRYDATGTTTTETATNMLDAVQELLRCL